MGIDFYGAKTFIMDPRLSADLIPPERVRFFHHEFVIIY
jgi:hypothetical protein